MLPTWFCYYSKSHSIFQHGPSCLGISTSCAQLKITAGLHLACTVFAHADCWLGNPKLTPLLLQSGRRKLLQASPPPPPPPSQEEQTLEQILAAVTNLQTGQVSLQTDITSLQTQVNAANAAASVRRLLFANSTGWTAAIMIMLWSWCCSFCC